MARILFADDEKLITELAEIHLSEHELTLINDVDQAIEAVKNVVYDLIVSDLDFKQPLNGIDIMRASIHSPNKNTPKIINTSFPRFTEEEKKVVKELEIEVVVGKPNMKHVVDAIQKKLQQVMKI